jgi:hypothetical protein
MCQAEGQMLQAGMTFRLPPRVGVILMSRKQNAPYQDAELPDGGILYEGHDEPRSASTPEPKQVDQPRFNSRGRPTQNGKFADWTDRYLAGEVPAAEFNVYEKLIKGIWTYRGRFRLVGYRYEQSGPRRVFRFVLQPVEDGSPEATAGKFPAPASYDATTRQIPTSVKQEVYKRDAGRCVLCGSRENLHFDHDLPYSKGGTSLTAANVRLLCARHNLSKGAKIE